MDAVVAAVETEDGGIVDVGIDELVPTVVETVVAEQAVAMSITSKQQ